MGVEKKVEKAGLKTKKEEKTKPKEEQNLDKKQPRKWKGKDWFAILAPDVFGGNVLSETPTTDPKTITGRNIEVGLDEITGNPNKYYMKMKFKIDKLDGRNAHTSFNGYTTSREYLFRVVRKRAQKVRIINNIETKDGWKLQATTLAILNRNADTGIQKKVRLKIESVIGESSKKVNLDDFIRSITSNSVQQNLKKVGSKIYPVRFIEIEKLEVLK